MPGYYCFDGKFIPSNDPVIGPDSRALRYGDGLFETIRVASEKIPLWTFHVNRLFKGIQTLGYAFSPIITPDFLEQKIVQLCRKNNLIDQVRVRLTFFGSDGGVYDKVSEKLHYLIQAWELPGQYLSLNTNGLDIVIFPSVRKSVDYLSNLKSNNFLCYLQAADYAKRQKANEALVLNSFERIADACTANVFWIKNRQIHTTPLSDGPVAGVMRAYLTENPLHADYHIIESILKPDALYEADEVFLTNATSGIRWVKCLDKRQFGNKISSQLYHDVIVPLFRH